MTRRRGMLALLATGLALCAASCTQSWAPSGQEKAERLLRRLKQRYGPIQGEDLDRQVLRAAAADAKRRAEALPVETMPMPDIDKKLADLFQAQ